VCAINDKFHEIGLYNTGSGSGAILQYPIHMYCMSLYCGETCKLQTERPPESIL